MQSNEPRLLAINLSRLAKNYVSTDPGQAAAIKREFKRLSFNDAVRTVVYLLEVVGARDQEFKNLVQENKDLKELCTLNGIDLSEKEEIDDEKTSEESPQGVSEEPQVSAQETQEGSSTPA